MSEMWIAGCIDDVADNVKSPEKSFVLGWPTENFVASFRCASSYSKLNDLTLFTVHSFRGRGGRRGGGVRLLGIAT